MKRYISKAIIYLLLMGASVLALAPFVWMLASSLKTQEMLFKLNAPLFPRTPAWGNYVTLITEYQFHTAALNSAYIAVIYTVGACFFCTLAGYAFNKFEFMGKKVLFAIVIGSMMIPFETTMIPLYMVFKRFGLFDSHIGLILPGLASAFGIFFINQYMYGLSSEILESGRIDGLGEFAIFRCLVIPITLPAMSSLAIIFFMNSWNNYLWPLIILKSKEKLTLAVALANLNSSPRFTPYHLLMAGSIISITPLVIIFLAFQKQFISGIAAGAVKG